MTIANEIGPEVQIQVAVLTNERSWSYALTDTSVGPPSVESRDVERSMNMRSNASSVFDAGLPTFDYSLDAGPHDILQDVRRAQSRAPIVMGPLGPEILKYDLARDMLRDNRFRMPQGVTLAAQGVTSGPLYDKLASILHRS